MQARGSCLQWSLGPDGLARAFQRRVELDSVPYHWIW